MLPASYFDGRSARVHVVDLSIDGDELIIKGADIERRIPFVDVNVDERLGHAPRRLRLTDGTFCEVRDLQGLDLLLSSTAHRDGYVDRMQRRLPLVGIALAACVLLIWIGYKVVLPRAAELGARRLSPAVGKLLSIQTLQTLDGTILQPSELSPERQGALTSELHNLILPGGGHPAATLLFRKSQQLGANAFTLPDGTIVLLDGLVSSIGDDQHVLAVLAHELGHAQGRHGLQLLLRTSAVGAFWSFYVGDISQLLAAAPAAIVQARYSQDLERQADDYAATLLLRNGLSPGLLADDLQQLAHIHPAHSHDSYLASHPPTNERMEHLRALAALPRT